MNVNLPLSSGRLPAHVAHNNQGEQRFNQGDQPFRATCKMLQPVHLNVSEENTWRGMLLYCE